MRDVISFVVTKEPNPSYQEDYEYWVEGGSWEEYKPDEMMTKVDIWLNGEPIDAFVSTYCLLNFKKTVDCYYSDLWKGLLYPQRNRSMFEPFTCSCGYSGCAGIWDGVHMKVRKHSVEWRDGKDMGYGFLPKRFFSFNKQQYFDAIDQLKVGLGE